MVRFGSTRLRETVFDVSVPMVNLLYSTAGAWFALLFITCARKVMSMVWHPPELKFLNEKSKCGVAGAPLTDQLLAGRVKPFAVTTAEPETICIPGSGSMTVKTFIACGTMKCRLNVSTLPMVMLPAG